MNTKINKVLIANRGEIASRIIRTLRALGVGTVAVYSDADRNAAYVHAADVAVYIGKSPAAESYLNADSIIAAAQRSGADAIHPGYGFLSENARFAESCARNDLIFIGPSAEAISTMGDKISARRVVESQGVPTVPGISRPGLTDDQLVDGAADIAFPVLIKPSAGGGGKGMHRVDSLQQLPDALVTARREAAAAFGDDSLFIEHFVETPRHIEVQILADSHGNVIHLGERECSLQRRHQKVIEEAPSPLLTPETRERIGQAACDAARSVGYVGAGTVEFIVSAKQPELFYFMEMNTRLQVEHPVTEEVTGLDLVELQLDIANGKALPLAQDEVRLQGHAVEVRVYAEDPTTGFLPTGGTIQALHEPSGPGIRVDAGVGVGDEIGSLYDPMLMKIIAHGKDRRQAFARMRRALRHTAVAGFATNTEFTHFLVSHEQVLAGELDTGLLERIADEFVPPVVPDEILLLAGQVITAGRYPHDPNHAGPWELVDGWRLSEAAPQRVRFVTASRVRELLVTGTPDDSVIELPAEDAEGNQAEAKSFRVSATSGETLCRRVDDQESAKRQAWRISVDGCSHDCRTEMVGDNLVLSTASGTWTLQLARLDQVAADEVGTSDSLCSPMPGTVIALSVAEDAEVEKGDPVLVVEAMKMEHTLRAEVPGRVKFHCAAGQQVSANTVLATIATE